MTGDSENDMTNGNPVADRAALRLLHDTQVSVEKIRIQVGNRVGALERGDDQAEGVIRDAYAALHDQLKEQEELFEALMAHEAEQHPAYPWLKMVKGIGPALASQLLSMLLPPLPGKGPSTWYKAAGLTVELRPDGLYRLPRARVGEGAITYYPRLRRCLHNVAESFVKVGGYYREVYDKRKATLQAKHKDDENWPPHRIDNVARWITVKLFLAHLWEMWCKAEGIRDRKSYVVDKLGHNYIPPPISSDGRKKV